MIGNTKLVNLCYPYISVNRNSTLDSNSMKKEHSNSEVAILKAMAGSGRDLRRKTKQNICGD